jgi:hypothetical protein
MGTLPFFIKYKETSNRTLHVPLRIAFSLGRYITNEGTIAGAGIRCLFKMITTKNTNTDIAATKRNINLSVIIFN